MLSRLAALRCLGGIKQTARVRRRAEQIGRLLPGGVIVGRYEHGVAALGRDLDRGAIVVDLLDQREQRPSRLTSCDRHRHLLSSGTRYCTICRMVVPPRNVPSGGGGSIFSGSWSLEPLSVRWCRRATALRTCARNGAAYPPRP